MSAGVRGCGNREGQVPVVWFSRRWPLTSAGLPLASVLPQGVAGCNVHAAPDVLLVNVQIGAYTAWLFPIPNNPALVGGSYWHQAVPFDLDGGGNVAQITASNAFRMLIGVR